jgi:hypothetical protein
VFHLLIRGPSYRNLGFEARERIRRDLRERLEVRGIRFVQYDWVWDEEDRCLLLVGSYGRPEDARWWARALESMGFDLCLRTQLPGEEPLPARPGSNPHSSSVTDDTEQK